VNFAIRAAKPEDAAAMARLQAGSFAEAWSAADIETLLTGPGGFGLVVDAGGRVAGFLIGRAAGGEAEILTVAVDEAHRRRGLGGALVEAAAVAAQATGAACLFLEVATDNTAGLALYEAAGFGRAGFRPAYYRRQNAPAADALVLRRDLTA
jgi:ribosomal-protein-alanine N-acetyltransferase